MTAHIKAEQSSLFVLYLLYFNLEVLLKLEHNVCLPRRKETDKGLKGLQSGLGAMWWWW